MGRLFVKGDEIYPRRHQAIPVIQDKFVDLSRINPDYRVIGLSRIILIPQITWGLSGTLSRINLWSGHRSMCVTVLSGIKSVVI